MPASVGGKVTLNVQLVATASGDAQLPVCEKSPESAIDVYEKGTSPVFVTVKARWADEPMAVAGKVAAPARVAVAFAPLPVSATELAYPVALDVRVSMPFRVPAATGSNVT